MPFLEHKSYYRIVGEPSREKHPLLLLHGGPGIGTYCLGIVPIRIPEPFFPLPHQGRRYLRYFDRQRRRLLHPHHAGMDIFDIMKVTDKYDYFD